MINRQRGVALLMVLFILALMMILASAMTERTAVMYQHTAVTLDNLQARWYALAAENMAAALLQRDALDSPSQTNLAQTWAQEGRRFTLDDGEIRATIRDGHACFNLNAINHRADEAGDGTPYPTDVFVRLLALLGEPPLRASQIAAALGDWTDSDGQPRLNGAEDEVYMAQTPGYLAANQPMQDVSELRLLAGMDAALYQRLLPFVCVQPDDALQVNVNTLRPSQAALLVALFPLVPGGGIYYTMEYCVSGNQIAFGQSLVHTLAVAGALALGIVLISSLFRFCMLFWYHRKKKKQCKKA